MKWVEKVIGELGLSGRAAELARRELERIAVENKLGDDYTEMTTDPARALILLAGNAVRGGGSPYIDDNDCSVHVVWTSNGDDMTVAVVKERDGELVKCVALSWAV